MDPEGARALAERIAAGPPREADGEAEADPRPSPPPRKLPQPAEPEASVEIVYVKPCPARRRDVRIYVRGEDGRLERSDP